MGLVRTCRRSASKASGASPTRRANHRRTEVTKKFPNLPSHPERVRWGCDHCCGANDMRCANGSDRTPHPVELFGERWRDWGESAAMVDTPSAAAVSLEP